MVEPFLFSWKPGGQGGLHSGFMFISGIWLFSVSSPSRGLYCRQKGDCGCPSLSPRPWCLPGWPWVASAWMWKCGQVTWALWLQMYIQIFGAKSDTLANRWWNLILRPPAGGDQAVCRSVAGRGPDRCSGLCVTGRQVWCPWSSAPQVWPCCSQWGPALPKRTRCPRWAVLQWDAEVPGEIMALPSPMTGPLSLPLTSLCPGVHDLCYHRYCRFTCSPQRQTLALDSVNIYDKYHTRH